MKSRTLYQTIENWLRQKNGQCFCDECVAREVGEEDRKTVKRATAQLGIGYGGEFSRYRARCTNCGNPGLVIAANSRFAWA